MPPFGPLSIDLSGKSFYAFVFAISKANLDRISIKPSYYVSTLVNTGFIVRLIDQEMKNIDKVRTFVVDRDLERSFIGIGIGVSGGTSHATVTIPQLNKVGVVGFNKPHVYETEGFSKVDGKTIIFNKTDFDGRTRSDLPAGSYSCRIHCHTSRRSLHGPPGCAWWIATAF